LNKDRLDSSAQRHVRRELAIVYVLSVLLLAAATYRRHRNRAANRGIHVVAGAQETVFRVDLNTACADELCLLPGIGRTTAQRIVERRRDHGRFRRVEDLGDVKGIAEQTLDTLRPHVVCGPGGRKAPMLGGERDRNAN
jgi:competence protein ComEA